ncbi:M4 family metallopeptidase [Fangia hongkongensis]|uniref:M4 family metallopeptidase n=1 Tax=Fangia hongkongensis TaxID=270495 RepID=UPI00038143CB|nr:M4 family metallopeptidase [Fangia hongkongensis]MBK2123981.1 M4 family metallopeptidase [Fangia hongkongensis]
MKLKKSIILSFSFSLLTAGAYATEKVNLTNAPIDDLQGFHLQMNQENGANTMLMTTPQTNTLNQISQSNLAGINYERYQQYYKGIKVIGAQITIAKRGQKSLLLTTNEDKANGEVIKNISLDTSPSISAQYAISHSLTVYNQNAKGYQVNYLNGNAPSAKLQIIMDNKQPKLIYQVQFLAQKANNQPQAMRYYVDAKTGEIITSWDNIQNFEDTGPGGNEKVHEYWYGQQGMPSLDVTQQGTTCTMENIRVRTVDLQQTQDDTTTPYSYTCGMNTGQDEINGAYSAINDAHYFGDIIIDMYKEWYGIDALTANNEAMQLVMRVHYGSNYDNAFWYNGNMTFGDGNSLYPLVSLDVAGHEVSHGFTEQHSGLVYTNQSGSLNEAFSDMAGQAVRAYLLSQDESNYAKFYPEDPEGQIGWGIGETIMKGDGALRYMNNPSQDGISADCYDPSLDGALACEISYRKMLIKSRGDQSYIVHTGSGVFNKAFYLLASTWASNNQTQGLSNQYAEGVKEAFHIMVLANVKYWTPSVKFSQAACGVIYAAKDLNYSTADVAQAFTKVGVSTSNC